MSYHIGQLMAVGCRTMHDVHWLMGQSPAEMTDWMTAISNTLPPPPNIPFDEKRLGLTHKPMANGHATPVANGCATIIPNGRCTSVPSRASAATCGQSRGHSYQQHGISDNYRSETDKRRGKFDNDHTVIAGVCLDWGHGWGWTAQTPAIAPQVSFTADVLSSSMYCHSAEDYTMSGYDDIDWSAFGDFCF